MNPQAADFLPSEVSYQELKASITSARALKNKVNSLLRATKPGALALVGQDDASIITRWERREAGILKSTRNRMKALEAQKKGVKGTEATIEGAKASRDIRPISSFSAQSLRNFIKSAEMEINQSSLEKAQAYFRNYMLALYSVFGGFPEYDSGIATIQNKIMSLAKHDFEALQDAIEDSPDIDYIYEPQERDLKWHRILEYWNSVYAPYTREVE